MNGAADGSVAAERWRLQSRIGTEHFWTRETMHSTASNSLVLVVALTVAACSSTLVRSEVFISDGAELDAISSEASWEIYRSYEHGVTFTKVDTSRFGWVPFERQAEAMALLEHDHCVKLSDEQAVYFGAGSLPGYEPPSHLTPFLLRGVRMIDAPDGQSGGTYDRLELKEAESMLRVIQYASRRHPYKGRVNQAVVAVLGSEPESLRPIVSLVFIGDVTTRH